MVNIDKKSSFFIIITASNKIRKLTALKVANNYEHTIFLFPWRYPAFHWLSNHFKSLFQLYKPLK
jgi:hypothetical protein